MSSKKIMKKLKEETTECHAKLESLPFFNSLTEHTLPLECYVNQLRALSVIHGVLENEISSVEDPRVSSIWNDELRKLALLEEDLAFFKPHMIPDADFPIEAALAMTEKIRLRRIENPVSLPGYLYVLEGSTLGNRMHRPDITATFQLNELNGCRYYASYQDRVGSHWNRFTDKMNQALNDSSAHDAVIEASLEAFSGLESVYKALYPLEGSRRIHVTRVNPEAGNHPVPEDEREIEAALKASDRAWESFGYYSQRYGERGKRFSDSDICWLVTLTDLDQKALQDQVDWICRVLATRGMPTLMMEQALEFLADELDKAIPDKAAFYDKLRVSAQQLKNARENRIQDAAMQTLAEEFEQAAGKMADTYRGTGRLLVAAVADEKNGIEGSINALKDWLTDGDRFSTEWIRAVHKIIDNAMSF